MESAGAASNSSSSSRQQLLPTAPHGLQSDSPPAGEGVSGSAAAAAAGRGRKAGCQLGGAVSVVENAFSRHQIGKTFGCSLVEFFALTFPKEASSSTSCSSRRSSLRNTHAMPQPANGDTHSAGAAAAAPAAAAAGHRYLGEGRASGQQRFRGSNDSDVDETQQEQQQQQVVQQRVGTQQQQQQQDEVLLSGRPHRISFESATQNFADSLAAYAVLSYLLQVLDGATAVVGAAAATGAAAITDAASANIAVGGAASAAAVDSFRIGLST